MKLRLFIHTFPPALRGRSRDVVQRRPDNKLPEYSPKNPRDPVQGNSFSKQKQHNKRRGEMGRWCCKELASERYIAEVASWCELMAVQTPTVNRESALGPVGEQPLSHLPSSPRFTTFWRVGTAIHNFYGRDSQLGSQLLAGKWHEWRSLLKIAIPTVRLLQSYHTTYVHFTLFISRSRCTYLVLTLYYPHPLLPLSLSSRPSRFFVNKMVSSCVLYMAC